MIAMNSHLEALVATTPTMPRLMRHHDGYSWTSYWRDDRGQLRTKRLGRNDEVTERQARARWHTWKQDEWTKPHVQNPDSDSATFSARMLAVAYREYAKTTFVKRGVPTGHLANVIQAMDAMENAWGDNHIVKTAAHKLAKLRDSMIYDAEGRVRSISTVNGRLSIIKAALIWGSTEQNYFPASAAHEFSLVKALRIGRCKAMPPKKILPVPDADRLAAQKAMPIVLSDMVEVQRLTGMRSGELVIMRTVDIDMSGREWLYTPESHKTEHLGKNRIIAIGPRAKRIIKKYLRSDIDAFIFSPRQAHAERLKAKRGTRKTKLWPSHKQHRTYRPSRRVGTRYTVNSYRRAIFYACVRAKVSPWHPHQLRHSFGTMVRERFDLEHAASGMGNTIQVAEVYAERSIATAKSVARKVG